MYYAGLSACSIVRWRKEVVAIYAVFGVGVGNLGHGRAPRRPMVKWVEILNRHLSHGHPSVRIVDFFGHTGNFLADSVSTDLEEVTARLKGLLETNWVVRPIDDVHVALTALADVSEPENEDGIRWTLGLAYHGGTGITCGTVTTTPRAVLWTISPCTHRSVETRQPWRRRNAGPGSARRWLGSSIRRH